MLHKEKIGFIDTGIMGRPMANNLLKAGFTVTVHNRTKQKVQPLIAARCRPGQQPR